MSTLVAQTLSNGTVSTSTANCIQGSAKAWVNFNGTGTVAIRASYNVSSITDNGTGEYTINFTTALPDANYGYALSNRHQAAQSRGIVVGSSVSTPTTTAFRIQNYDGTTTLADVDYICVTIFD